MKKIICILVTSMVLSFSSVYAGTGDIVKTVIKPDSVLSALDTVLILFNTSTCKITYRQLDADGNSVGNEKKIWMDVADDPETVKDETRTAFTDLLTSINAGSDIKATIKAEFEKK